MPHLASLTAVTIGLECTASLTSCFKQQISTMVGLQQLDLAGGPITASTLPGVECLTALQDLELWECDLEPSCLQPMTTGLTMLHLYNVALQPEQAQHDSALGTSQLLQLLRRCSALQKLALESISGVWPQQLSAHSALTASSKLQQLELRLVELQGAAWPHVFPAGRKLPQLHTFITIHEDGDTGPAPCGSADIAHLVSCCPALEVLHIQPQPDASLGPLQSLTALTGLDIGPVSPAVIRRDLTALTRLRSLQVSLARSPGQATPSAHLRQLLPLTALTGQTQLGSLPFALKCSFRSHAPRGTPPDVWVQLLEKCAADPHSQPAVISSVVRQLQQQREQVAQQAAQLQQQQEQGAHQAVLLQRHEHELAAARAEAAELHGQMQALQGQLQEVLAALKPQRQA